MALIKKDARKYLKEIILHIKGKENKSIALCKELFSFLSGYRVIALYAAMKNEVNLDPLIGYLLRDGKVVLLPKVYGKQLRFYQIMSLSDLRESNGYFHIREPLNGNVYEKEDIEVIIVPGIGFDNDNNRLGRGGGYYDRYLNGFRGKKIGVAFKEQILDFVPHEEFDVPMDLVIKK
ncbi:MAG: 5-formyltetrahydrofolate cyclo-ligase [Bacilli bacterium]|nr:5-formyltetrahydrofolate cyclo-ligase [Bacilli bacterium]